MLLESKVQEGFGGGVDEREPERDDEGRIFLNCPFGDKEACKKAGGRWDMARKKWFVTPNSDAAPFRKWWPPLPPLPPTPLPSTASELSRASGEGGAGYGGGGGGGSDMVDSDGAKSIQSSPTTLVEGGGWGEGGRESEGERGGQEVKGGVGGNSVLGFVDAEDDRYFQYEPEVLQEDYAKEIEALDPKTFSDRPPHPTQEGWIDDYYSKWIQTDPAGRELQVTKSQQ